ncbi:MAG: helix-turn-helix domain-containing protein [Bacteroidetes bacterium]|jgi:hypothetical protein|nr:helix-turn-helix domain-containing protein [Bacteroidota bacterium]MBT5530243.1 helix-turn-helix domain-containing protein [Cytophagia bacterium]MBT3424057.1 helix-turn-helix domain-containing protein [Bacteroidota bacterium]MBT3801445.1 helix-turn-helix domain-containing protein [Bacteroidota bacterium]MBT4338470.1 helix-turn-helix domain-containing protein [Bacteroidota bacterium]
MKVITIESIAYKKLLKKIDKTSNDIQKLTSVVTELKERVIPQENRWIDSRDLCKMLKVSNRTLQKYRDKGKISFIKFDGKILYKPEDVINEIERSYFKSLKS